MYIAAMLKEKQKWKTLHSGEDTELQNSQYSSKLLAVFTFIVFGSLVETSVVLLHIL